MKPLKSWKINWLGTLFLLLVSLTLVLVAISLPLLTTLYIAEGKHILELLQRHSP